MVIALLVCMTHLHYATGTQHLNPHLLIRTTRMRLLAGGMQPWSRYQRQRCCPCCGLQQPGQQLRSSAAAATALLPAAAAAAAVVAAAVAVAMAGSWRGARRKRLFRWQQQASPSYSR
jgi:hypothetical protein